MKQQVLQDIFSKITDLKSVSTKHAPILRKLISGDRVIDLLLHVPVNYINRVALESINANMVGSEVVVDAHVLHHMLDSGNYGNRFSKTRRQSYKIATLVDKVALQLVFFNAHAQFLANTFRVGAKVKISGKLAKSTNGVLQIIHPKIIKQNQENKQEDLIESADVVKKGKEIYTEPVYSLTAGIANWQMQKFAREALSVSDDNVEPEFFEALKVLHCHSGKYSISKMREATRKVAFDEFLADQIAVKMARLQSATVFNVEKRPLDGALSDKLMSMLPFKLTKEQERAYKFISDKQSGSAEVAVLVQGDVGCGKTIVGFLAILNRVSAGFQGAFVAPTAILAAQHFEFIEKYSLYLNIKVELLTSDVTALRKEKILERLRCGDIDIIIGTHALFEDGVLFKSLGIAVIDEQHRFGVGQRSKMASKGKNIDLIMMTATPIPRTLSIAMYGDVESVAISSKPAGRKDIQTSVMPIAKLDTLVCHIKAKIEKEGAMVYWVCPLIGGDESDGDDEGLVESESTSALERFNSLSQEIGNDKVALLHGKMKEKEKNEIIKQFKDGLKKVIVATTVIEVGISVPGANIIVIESAQKFGLSQLHQLRGRVGRDENVGYCILLYNDDVSYNAKRRLEVMKNSLDGFYIAEQDLELRGAGEILGVRQSGFCTYRVADPFAHKDLMMQANKECVKIFSGKASGSGGGHFELEERYAKLLNIFRSEFCLQLIKR